MPPIPPSQGSRTGLITALVVFVILFVTSTVLYLNAYSKWDASEKKYTAFEDATKAFVSQGDRNAAEIVALKSSTGSTSAIQNALGQSHEFARQLTGNAAAAPEVVRRTSVDTLKGARADLADAKVTAVLTDDNMYGNIKVLTEQIKTQAAALAQAQADAKSANDKATAAVNERTTALAEKDKAIADANKKAEDAVAMSKGREDAIGGNVAAIQKSSNDALAAANQQTAAAQAELSKSQGMYKALDIKYNKLLAELDHYRLNPSRSLLRPAGVVTRVPGNNIVFINLGDGDQISPGLTFEVYDKIRGLPSLTATNPDDKDALLPGKASIEVIRVIGPTAECRVIHLATGQTIVEGDLILNLIYNTHTKFVFNIYGEFDLAGNGQANAADSELLRRMVSQWGGRVSDQVNVDTDFVVLGKEPEVPKLTDNPTPLENERREKALKAADDYAAIRSAAYKLNIPVLNQNRFLYFIGYYDQARR